MATRPQTQRPFRELRLITDPEFAQHIGEILRALAHPLRVQIVAVLRDGPRHVSSLCEELHQKQAPVSQQLRILRMNQIVTVERTGGFAYYRLALPSLANLIDCMEGCSLASREP